MFKRLLEIVDQAEEILNVGFLKSRTRGGIIATGKAGTKVPKISIVDGEKQGEVMIEEIVGKIIKPGNQGKATFKGDDLVELMGIFKTKVEGGISGG